MTDLKKTEHVIDDDEHTDPDQPDIGKAIDLSEPIDDDLDVGDLEDLLAQADAEVE
jgi:hypothetical protein